MSVLGPAVAGRWYPGERDALAALVDRLLDEADARAGTPRGGHRAAIAPHAGFEYSGAVASGALRAIAEPGVRRVVLLGPSHYFGFGGAAVPHRAGACRTPLGDVPIDRDAVLDLCACPVVEREDGYFEPEHALEAELPFLQRLLPDGFTVVPVLLGADVSPEIADQIASSLAEMVDETTRVVASSDFTHYGRRFGYVPFVDELPARLHSLDLGAIRTIEAGDAEAFARYLGTTGATVCGRRAIDVLLRLPAGRRGGRLLEYDTSGRMTGAWDLSVSYASILFPGAAAC